jgi:hypothetical protein
MSESISTRSREVIDALMVSLKDVRTIEKTIPYEIKYQFGNLQWNLHNVPPIIIWLHQGGTVLKKVQAPNVEELDEDGNVINSVPAVGYRRALYIARIWMPGRDRTEQAANCEHVLDQLVTASLQLDFPEKVSFVDAPYKFPSEVEGKWLEYGGLLDTTVYIQSSVPAKPTGETILVEVQGPGQFKTAIVDEVPKNVDTVPDDKFDPDTVDPEPITWVTEDPPDGWPEWEG